MSITITARAIPTVALSAWETIDQFLLFQHGDWDSLRGALIDEICAERSGELGAVTDLERMLLKEYFSAPPVYAGFQEVLSLVRSELSSWHTSTLDLAQRLIDSGDQDTALAEGFRAAAKGLPRPGSIVLDGQGRGVLPQNGESKPCGHHRPTDVAAPPVT